MEKEFLVKKTCTNCGQERLEFVKKTLENGTYQIRQQCGNCGYVTKVSLSHKYFENPYNLPEVDNTKEQKSRFKLYWKE